MEIESEETNPLLLTYQTDTEKEEVIDLNFGILTGMWRHGWKSTSPVLLKAAEKNILRGLKSKYELFFVETSQNNKINTLKLGNGPPLVMLHGFGGGLGLWITNLDKLSNHFTIYAIDLLGFGRSSRPVYNGLTAEDGEKFFIDGFEEWRQTMGLNKFNLLGHSLGGFLSAAYALQNPEKIDKLILTDPWGVPKKPDVDPISKLPLRWRLTLNMFKYVNPLSLLRAAGPYGPSIINRVRPDLSAKFEHLFEDHPDTCSQYIFHLNAQYPSGELAFNSMQIPWGFAVKPLIDRIPELNKDIHVYVIYGNQTWMDRNAGIQLIYNMKCPYEIIFLPDAGHHVYVDNHELFNKAVVSIGKNNLKQFAVQHSQTKYELNDLARTKYDYVNK